MYYLCHNILINNLHINVIYVLLIIYLNNRIIKYKMINIVFGIFYIIILLILNRNILKIVFFIRFINGNKKIKKNKNI
jgi:hypothetical protein